MVYSLLRGIQDVDVDRDSAGGLFAYKGYPVDELTGRPIESINAAVNCGPGSLVTPHLYNYRRKAMRMLESVDHSS